MQRVRLQSGLTAQPAENHPDVQGLHLKLDGKSPFDPDIAVEMRKRALNAKGVSRKGQRGAVGLVPSEGTVPALSQRCRVSLPAVAAQSPCCKTP